MNYKVTFHIIILFLPVFLLAQESLDFCTDSTYCVPGITGMPRTKGLVIRQERVKNYSIRSYNLNGEKVSEGVVNRNKRWTAKLKLPILLKENLKLGVGLNYFIEEYNFDSKGTPESVFYQNLENKPLQSMGLRLYGLKTYLGRHYLIFRLGGNLNGDINNEIPTSRLFRGSATVLYGKKVDPMTSYAFGIAYSYSFGPGFIYPIFSYNRRFNNNWAFESNLPVKAELMYNTNNHKNFFFVGYNVQGSNYNITFAEPIEDVKTYFLSKAEVRGELRYEREIYDFVWLSTFMGVRHNVIFDLEDSFTRRGELLWDNKLAPAFYFGGSIFLVPPKKWVD